MANHAGVSLPQNDLLLITKGQTGSLLNNTYPRPVAALPIEALDGGNGSYLTDMVEMRGPSTRNFPWTSTRAPVINHAGYQIGTYSASLFGHFLLVPSELTLGNLLSNQSHTIEIANLFSVPMELVSVTNNAGDGITFADLPTLPATIPAYGSIEIEVQVSTSGPPSISGTVVLVGAEVGGGEPQSLVVNVTGTRLTMFPFDPEQGYTEELQWKTDIIESYAGLEQRIKLRQNPRQVLNYQVFAADTVTPMATQNPPPMATSNSST